MKYLFLINISYTYANYVNLHWNSSDIYIEDKIATAKKQGG